MIEKVRRALLDHNMVQEGHRVLVAVSGGPDSCCLLDVLHRLSPELSLRLHVYHLNHRWRGAESDMDARFVSALAERMGLEATLEEIDVPELLRCNPGRSPEAVAREARYGAFRAAADRLGADRVALGHTLNDQAETVLMRVIKGTGVDGLAGIPPVREGLYIRPLLWVSRREVEAYCREHGIAARRDSLNADEAYLRNRIRLKLIPLLEAEYNPRVVEALARLAEGARADVDYLRGEALRLFADAVQMSRGEARVSIPRLLKEPAALQRRIVRAAAEKLRGYTPGLELKHVNSILAMAAGPRPNASLDLPGGLKAVREYDSLRMSHAPRRRVPADVRVPVRIPGMTLVRELDLRLEARVEGSPPAELRDTGPNEAWLDMDKLHEPLAIRTRRHGDRFVPLGMQGSVKLKDFFVANKVPVETRDRVPLLVSGDEIVWVVGLRIDGRFRVTPHTRSTLHLVASVEPAGAPGERFAREGQSGEGGEGDTR